MGKKPKSVTIIAWLLIVSGVISLFTSLLSWNSPIVKELMAKNPLPIPLQYVMMYIGSPISVISGAGIFKGKNWGRLLYVLWGATGIVINLITFPIKLTIIIGLVVFAIVAFFLYRPASNQYFAQK